jgi:anti-sigma regulatory factor (Ser/Thr protein kinase)
MHRHHATSTVHYQLAQPSEAYGLANLLAQHLPTPEQYITAIYELLMNAIEHGNLGMHFEEKNALIRTGQLASEMARRLALPENADKQVHVMLRQKGQHFRLTIRDQGKGFDWRRHMTRGDAREQLHGRGLRLALSAKFDRIVFNEAGNQVTCLLRYRDWESTPQERQMMAQNI